MMVKPTIHRLIFIGYPSVTSLPEPGAGRFIDGLDTVFIDSANFVFEEFRLLIDEEGILGTALIINARSVTFGISTNLLSQIKDDHQLNALPIVVISDRSHFAESLPYIQAGADDFYGAPVQWNKLWERLLFLAKYKRASIDVALALDTTFLKEKGVTIPIWKRLIDISVGITGLVVLSPILLIVAIAIRMESKGSVIYRSTRVGSAYSEFSFWKFRSMYVDADTRLEQLLKDNQYGEGATFKKFMNDPRITRVGRFIRKYSIDELPQLYNILKGDMSLVGNRPLPVYEAAQLVNYEAGARFLAPAGLTGLWQVNKRGQEEMSQKDRIDLDLKYADCSTLWTDVKIIAKTFTAFIQKGDV